MPTQLINLNDTTPSAPGGGVNVHFQADPVPADPNTPRNVSAYVTTTVPAGQWRTGIGAPAGGLGNNGDMYLDTSTSNVYGPKASGAWGSVVENITGPIGPAGSNGTNGTIASRGNVAVTTASLADGASQQGYVTIGKSFAITEVVADRDCRLRIYSTRAKADADLTRLATVSPAYGSAHGVILDLVVNGVVGLDFILSPEAYGANCEAVVDNQISYTITNMSGSASTVTVTMTCKIEEA